MARLRAIAIAAVASMVVAPVSIAGDLSELFEGRWTGNGTIRPQGFNPPEKARCKVVGTALVGGGTRFSGRCATVSGSGTFKMTIRLVPGTERYDVEAQLPHIVQTVRMRGSARGRVLTFTLRNPLKQDGRTVTAGIGIRFPDDGSMKMTQTVRDISTGERAQAVSMVFEKQ
ncbi:MAG: hypothetical protein NXI27_26925 [Alphaproteobacteria bacterium]|nr:hypothetical protein [Alphaproteobacteria bacterium]